MKDKITSFIDLFYPLAKPFMPLQTFRYAFCGGSNMLFDLGLFYVFYHFVFQKEVVDIGIMAFEPYVAAYFIAFAISFPTGFLMSKYIVWTNSNLTGKVQFARYFIQVMINLLLNYLILKLFIEVFHFYPTPAKMLNIVLSVAYSYLSQKHFTFKERKQE